jgi:RNA recognition motif-containing protein
MGSDGNSRGFGFIRYALFEDQKKVAGQVFQIEGRTVQVKKPHSQQQGQESCRVFVGRLNETITKEDVTHHFSQFGTVQDTYYDHAGRKQYGFVTFEDAEVAACVLAQRNHIIKDVQVTVNNAEPQKKKAEYQMQQQAKLQQSHQSSQQQQPMSPMATNGGFSGNGCYSHDTFGVPPPQHSTPQMDPALFGQEMLNAMAKMMAGAMNNSQTGGPTTELRHPANTRSPSGNHYPGAASGGYRSAGYDAYGY